MQVPAGTRLNTIDRMLLMHDEGIIRIDKSPYVIGANLLGISYRLDRIDAGRRLRSSCYLRFGMRGAAGEEQNRDKSQEFHGLSKVRGLNDSGNSEGRISAADSAARFDFSSSRNGCAEPPIAASARSMVCRTYK